MGLASAKTILPNPRLDDPEPLAVEDQVSLGAIPTEGMDFVVSPQESCVAVHPLHPDHAVDHAKGNVSPAWRPPVNFPRVRSGRSFLDWVALGLVFLSLAGFVCAATAGLRYTGRVLYRGNKASVAGVLVEIVEAEDNGEPTNDVLGSARADAEGRFAVVLSEHTDKPVTLVVSAVRATAETGGNKSESGIEVKTHRTMLGFLPHPSATKPNSVFIERRTPGRHSDR